MRKSSNKGGRKPAKPSRARSAEPVSAPERTAPKAGPKPKVFGAKTASAPVKPTGSIAARILNRVKATASGMAARVTGGRSRKPVSKAKVD